MFNEVGKKEKMHKILLIVLPFFLQRFAFFEIIIIFGPMQVKKVGNCWLNLLQYILFNIFI